MAATGNSILGAAGAGGATGAVTVVADGGSVLPGGFSGSKTGGGAGLTSNVTTGFGGATGGGIGISEAGVVVGSEAALIGSGLGVSILAAGEFVFAAEGGVTPESTFLTGGSGVGFGVAGEVATTGTFFGSILAVAGGGAAGAGVGVESVFGFVSAGFGGAGASGVLPLAGSGFVGSSTGGMNILSPPALTDHASNSPLRATNVVTNGTPALRNSSK